MHGHQVGGVSTELSEDVAVEESPVAREVLAGLAATRKSIAPKYFYDRKGSDLFSEITRLPCSSR